MRGVKQVMGMIDRLSLMHNLNSIPQEQLLAVIFAINPPSGIIPPNSTSQGQQVYALLKWAESPSGCGLEQVQEVLKTIIKPLENSPTMTEEKPQSNQPSPESELSFETEKKASRKFIEGTAAVMIQWTPLGTGGWFLLSFLKEAEPIKALFMLPIMIILTAWAAYSQSILKRIQEVYSERGSKDVDSFIAWMTRVDQAIRSAIYWQLAGTDDKYLRCQGNDCVQYKTEGLNNIFKPQLRDVFVALELSGSFLRDFEDQLLPLFPGFSWNRQTIQETLRREGLSIWYMLRQALKNPIYRSLIIQAWGGYGKTTLLRHVTYIYTQKLYTKRPYNAPKLLPVLLYLRQWQKLIGTTDFLDLPTLIEKHHIPNLPEGQALNLPPNWAINHLRQGTMLVMFDGFDEVKEEWRNKVSEWIGTQLRNYPQGFFILTSRPAGYRQYEAENKPNTPLFIKPFNDDQIEGFVQRWYLSWERHLSSEPNQPAVAVEANRKAASLSEQLKSIQGEKNPLYDLAKNPLLLNMIVNLHCSCSTEKLPQRRTDLYRAIVRLQLGDRPLAREIDMPLDPSDSQEVLQSLALFMVQNNTTEIEPEQLIEKLREYLSNINSVSAEDFLKKIEQVSELLVRVDYTYEFAHKSFQEYLAACEIKQKQQEDLLIQNWQDQWWKETILLYTAQLRNPSDFIRRLISLSSSEAIALAYECLKETPRQVDSDVAAQLQLLSATVQNARYHKLEELLKNQQWKDADYETYRLMIETVGKEKGQWFEREDIENFPCEDLRTIDQLWVQYSKGRFGFSVQKNIWLEVGGKVDVETEEKLGDRVGWRQGGEWMDYDSLQFNLSAPPGHLPLGGVWLGGCVLGFVGGVLLSRKDL